MPSIIAFTAMFVLGQTKNPKAQTGTKPVDRTKAVIGTTYGLGPAGSRVNVKVTEAWYSMQEPRRGELVVAEAEQKLLTLRLEIQNPETTDRMLYNGTFGIKYTGADDQSMTPEVRLYSVVTGKPVDQALRPAQKIEALLTVPVSADGPMYKVFFHYSEDKPLVFDFRGKAKDKLGDWSGGDGIVKPEIIAKVGVPFFLGEWQWTIDEVLAPTPDVTDADGNVVKPAAGVTYHVKVKNLALLPRDIYQGTCSPYSEDENGQNTSETSFTFRNSTESASCTVAPEKEIKATMSFSRLASKVTKSSLTLRGRTVLLPVPE